MLSDETLVFLSRHKPQAREDLVAITRDLGLPEQETKDDPRVTVRLRCLLDQVSQTLQGKKLPTLEAESVENDDGTNITTLASLCHHADDLISGIKGSNAPPASSCAVQ